jgi:hypothetical protein
MEVLVLPSMGPESGKRVKTRPHLVVRIRDGWHFDEKKSQFVSEQQQCVETKADLPPRSRVEYRIPHLAKAARGSLSDDEADLLRYFNVILPSGSDPSNYRKVVKRWPCVEDVQLPPEIGLPDESRAT